MKNFLCAILATLISASAFAAGVINVSTDQPIASVTAAKQDELVEQLLTVSGLKRSLQHFQEQVAPSVQPSATGNDESAKFQNEMAKIYSQAYPKDGFVNRVRAALKSNYDEKRYARLLQMLSTPLAKRMTELEAFEPTPEDFQSYLSQVAAHPLTPERIKLTQSMDTASRASALLVNITMASLESNAIAMSDDCIVDVAKIRKQLAKSRPEIEKSTRRQARVATAFAYRDVSDLDLSAYLKIFQGDDGKWLQDHVQAAIEEQYKSGLEIAGRGVRRLAQSLKPKKTMFAPKCDGQEEPVKEEITPTQPAHKAQLNKTGRDLRECLRFEDSAQVITCTEKLHGTRI